ncbi:metalloregulator ArsR/SmtB family transcription factor [Sedimenticola sp.]|uniref:metalloregulator ArsR/SmtB family transcription factor n=1 Tax=Sedimenticola sp. TaxID=1940285 RepID=UPI00258E35FA|nr:metalloregulator ArsR/SmtB family transcription factor [Sedimenticola sp.]MCW8904880.1 metalloregulator ArsR/SmtB family transcription factor [Sedimenticola sp.]
MEPSTLFKALSDRTRLRCIALLSRHDELCVCELTEALDLPQPKISHHLAALRRAGLVIDRKEGLWIHYRISPDLPDWAASVIQTTASGIADQEPFAGDGNKLHATNQRATELCAT